MMVCELLQLQILYKSTRFFRVLDRQIKIGAPGAYKVLTQQ